jgi:SAM-dependent methyltransferase
VNKEKIQKTISKFWDHHFTTEISNDYWTCHPIINEYVNTLIAPGCSNILAWFARTFIQGKPFERGLSIGCGTGAAERQAIQEGVCQFMDGIDISPVSIEMAKQAASKAGLDGRLHYSIGNLNTLQLPKRYYDFALCVGSIHHVENLEHLFNELKMSLKPGSFILINEYVGPSRLQWTEKQLKILNNVWEIMPNEFRKTGPLSPVDQGELIKVDPSEAICSSEIIPFLYNNFEIVAHIDYGGSFLMPFWSQGIIPDVFLDKPDKEKQVIIKLLCLIDELLLEEKMLPTCYAQFVVRNNPPAIKKPFTNNLRIHDRKRWTEFWLDSSYRYRQTNPKLIKKAFYMLQTEGFIPLLRAVLRYSKRVLLQKGNYNL